MSFWLYVCGDIKGIGAEHFVRVFDGEKGGDVSQNKESSQLFRDLGNTVGHSPVSAIFKECSRTCYGLKLINASSVSNVVMESESMTAIFTYY